MTTQARPLTPARLLDELADRIASTHPDRWLRVALDGPAAADPDALAHALVDPVRVRGRAARVILASDFLRPASTRLELGHTNPDSFYERWLDESGLRREVLSRLSPTGSGDILPRLWDPHTDRATRADYEPVPPGAAVIVSGALLLGSGLPFDLTIHLALSPAALARRTPAAQRWTLPAYTRYQAEVDPRALADVVIRSDDPNHPAVAYPA